MQILKTRKLLAALLLATLLGQVQAATVTWVGGVDNNWNTAANWDINANPTSGDDVVFDAGSNNVTLNTSAFINSITFTSGYTGTFTFTNYSLTLNGGDGDFRSGGSIVPGSGNITFAGSSLQTYYPKGAGTMPALTVSASGGVAISTNALQGGSIYLQAGTLYLGSGFTHTVASLSGSSGSLDFGSSTLRIESGNADFSTLTTITPGTGAVEFIHPSANQTLYPNPSEALPAVNHTGAGTLTLGTQNLACASFLQSAGTLDFNGRSITTTGNFTVASGTAASFSNLDGVTLAVGGNASLSGTSTSERLNLNPAAAWSLNAGGTLTAAFAYLGNSTAGGSTGECSQCLNGGGNSNWTYVVTWDGGGADDNWSTPSNWDGDFIPLSGDKAVFNAGSDNATVDGAASVASITFTTGYTGTFSFGSSTLSVSGNADFRSGGAIDAGTGALAFNGTGSQTFIPRAAGVFPAIIQNGNAGTTTITTNALTAGNLTLTLGTFHLGAGMTHSVGAVSGGGALDFGTSNLNAAGNVAMNGLAVTAASSNTLAFTGAAAQTYTPNASEPDLNLTQNGTGGTTVASYNFTTPLLTITAGTFNLGASRQHIAAELSVTGGGLNFGSACWLDVSGATVDLSSLATLVAGSGDLRFAGSGAQTFIPKAGAVHPGIWKNGSGTTTVTTNNLMAGSLTPTGGTFHMGAGLNHTFTGLSPGGGPYGSIHFGSSQAHFSGHVNLGSLPTVTAGTGSIHFNAPTGTQIFTPKNGTTHPAVVHSGAGTLQLAVNNLVCASFTQNGGPLDLNGRNLQTTGNLTVSNGTSTTFTGLAGRTLTVGGNANLAGASTANRLNLNPGTNWTLAMTGTANAVNAQVTNSIVSGTVAVCIGCVNGGNNSSWTFPVIWDGGGADANWSTAGNWDQDFVPSSGDDVVFDAGSINAALDANINIKSIVFTSGYTGAFSFASFGMTVNAGKADFRSGSTMAGGTGTLAFTGNANQVFTPKAGGTMPSIHLNGTGGVTIANNALVGGNLTLQSGNLNLNSGFTHSVVNIVPGAAGGIIFNNSILQASGASVSFNNLGTLNYGTGTLVFNGAAAQTFTGKNGVFHPHITQNGSGGTTIAANNWTTGTLTVTAGVLNLGTGLSLTAGAFSATGGGIHFGSSNLEIGGAAVDFSPLASVTPGTGTLTLWNNGAHTFTPKASTPHPSLTKYGTGTLSILSNALQVGNLALNQGTLDLGSGFTHSAISFASSGGTLTFNNSTLRILAGNANFGSITTMNAGTGSLDFAAASGTQIFTPRTATTHPNILHSGAGELELGANDLTCLSFSQGAGVLDFNGRNITTTSGNFAIANGNSGSLIGLAGRTLTVAANASFNGAASASRLNLNPGSAWTLDVDGTVTASLATLGNSDAGSTPGGTCTNCSDAGGNVNWTSNVEWDGGGGSPDWSTADNWASDAVPASSDNVHFNTGSAGASLTSDVSVGSLTFTSDYTGAFDIGSNDLTIATGNADFRSGGAITGTGAIHFAGSGNQSFIPKTGATFPSIVQSGTGTTTLATNALAAGDLTVSAGTFHLGASLTHTLADVGGSGALNFGTSNLNATGDVDLSALTVTAAASNTLSFTGSSAQTYTPNASEPDLSLAQNGSGGTALAGNITTQALSISSGTLTLGSAQTHTVSALTISGGGLDFGSSTFKVSGATLNFSNLSPLTAGTGTLEFTGASAQTLYPNSSAAFPALVQSGTGTTTVSTIDLTAGSLSIGAGTFNLGSGLTHSVSALTATGGTLTFDNSTLRVTGGNADLSGLATLNANTGTLAFTAASGTQVFTPKASVTHPAINHSGAGTVQLASNDLACASLAQSAGGLDLNGRNVNTTGAFTVTNGSASSFSNLAGRTLTVAGNASFTGQAGSPINMNPASAWTLAVSGTLTANTAQIMNCNASVNAGNATASADGGNNTNWSFSITWDGGGADNNWSTAGNWNSDAVPSASTAVVFNGTSVKNVTLDGPATVKSLTLTSAYTGTFAFSTNTLSITGTVDLRTGGAISAGSGSLAFTGSLSQALLPPASGTMPNLNQNGAGGTTLSVNALNAGSLTLSSGTFNLGNGFTHAVASIGGTGGNLSFGSSTLQVAGNADLSGIATLAAGTGRLEFTGAANRTFTPKAGATHPRIAQTGTGASTVSGNDLVTNSLRILAGSLNLGTALTVTATDTLAATGGTLDFGSSTLRTGAETVTLTGLASLVAGTGTLEFTGAAVQTFSPKASVGHPAIIQSGAGSTVLAANPLTASSLSVVGGTFDLGDNGHVHAIASVSATGGALDFGTSTLQVSGNADLSGLATLTAASGKLSFTAATGTQVFTPKNGATAPFILHAAAGTVALSAYDLICLAFTQTAGTWDLGTRNITVSGAGNLDVSGSANPFANLGGRTLTVGGTANFQGTWANPMFLNPGTAWTIGATAGLTAANVRLRNSNAPVAAGSADSSQDLGGNTGWAFVDSILPDNVSGLVATALTGNSVGLAWTGSPTADAESVILRYRTDGVYPTSSTDGTLWRAVAAAKTADTATGLADKTIYHFAAFVEDTAGNSSPVAAGARDSARTPDITPPVNVTGFTAAAASAASSTLAWTPSSSADADSVMIRYRTGLAFPANATDGTLWKILPTAQASETVTGLNANTLYAFGLFVRDSSGNYSPAQSGAQDTSLFQLPVFGTMAIQDISGFTKDPDPALFFTWSGADSIRFSLLADTGTAAWRSLADSDSLTLTGADGQKILAAQFKNIFGTRSAWTRDTTVLDRGLPTLVLDHKAVHGRWNWPVSASGIVRDAVSKVERVFVMRRRLSDGYYFNGTAWAAPVDTAKLVLSAGDSLFAAPLPVSAMATGDYQIKAYAVDRAGNAGGFTTLDVHYEDNRPPESAFSTLPDTLLQNQMGAFKVGFGDRDSADSLSEVSVDLPAWLQAAPGPDTMAAPYALHKVYTLSGKPGQAHVGNNLIQIRVKDRGGLLHTYSKTVSVSDVNDPPVFADSQATYSVKEDSASRWTPVFKDLDPNDTHAMVLLEAPAFATLNGLEITFKPLSRDVGDHTVRLTVSDGPLLDTLETLLTVVDVNDPPFAFHGTGWSSPFFFREDQADTFTVVVVDMDKNEAINLATQMPAWVKVTSTVDSTGFNRTFRFAAQPSQQDTGSLSLSLNFMDARNAVSQLAFAAKVLAENDMPTATIDEVRAHAGAARFKLSVQDEDGSLEKARFHYRLVGAAGDTLRRGITPSSLLALHPLADGAYKLLVLAEDQDGLKQPAFTEAPFTISGATALSLDTARWHMIGVPQASLPAATFGSGAVLASWDEVGDDGQPMARYTSGKVVEALKRGKGYWVRLTQPVQLKAEQKDLLQGPFNLKLTHSKQGWNQIANPYPYWIDLSATKLTFWEWDADKRDLVNARGLLKPWAAYWVLAPKDTVLAVADAPYFPATQQALAKGAAAEPGILSRGGSLAYEGALMGSASEEIAAAWAPSFRHREDWSVGLSLRAGFYQDRSNIFGVRPASTADPASSQTPDAPKFGEYIALHFEKEARGLAADYRASLHADEEWWDFSVENTGTGENQALLTPAGLEGLAAHGLKVFLVKQGEARPVEPGGSVALAMEGEKTWYSLVVTPHADFASRLKGNFSISQNFPNPVITFTAFRFFLPQSWDKDGKRMAKDFKLRINLYDHNGRQVAQAVSGTFRPGSHTLVWKPVSQGGGALAKGAYIYRLETAGFAKSLKMVLE